MYDKAFNEYLHAKLKSLQYNATLAITGAIRGFSTKKSYKELGLESSKSRRWCRKMRFLYKVLKSESTSDLFNTIPNSDNRQHQTRNSGNDYFKFSYKVLKSESPSDLFNTIPNSNNRQHQTRNSGNNYFKNSFLPSAITEWDKLDCYIRNADIFKVFKKYLLTFIRSMPNSI